PFVSGLVQGPETFLSGVGSQAKFDATVGVPASWPVFNIDGYVFRIRQGVVLDLATDSAGAALGAGDVLYFYVSRFDYGNATTQLKLASDPAIATARDLRQLQSGADGVIS